ncbi:helix-turn-helix transcriptional regulator [Halomarina halobia]|uniref:Helix-turn-helix transcriptional regulator n=1 Tax=Halomarina halobia TaxID=3033386 RepID=A0ABD6AFT3_9EURY|nr:helix-turn-helix transcriptional regulator [Halomarina sp. PSR21]
MADSDPPDETGSAGGNPPSASSVDFSTYNLPTDLTAFQINLLCLIYRFGPVAGVTLQNALEELYPEDINHGRLYPSLDRMVDSGLASKQTKESDKRRKEYDLTGRGEWVAEEYLRFVRKTIVHDS